MAPSNAFGISAHDIVLLQGQAGRGFEQPGLEKGVPPHGRGTGIDDL